MVYFFKGISQLGRNGARTQNKRVVGVNLYGITSPVNQFESSFSLHIITCKSPFIKIYMYEIQLQTLTQQTSSNQTWIPQ